MALDQKIEIHMEYDGEAKLRVIREQRFSNITDLKPRIDKRETSLTQSNVLFSLGAEEVYFVDSENGDRFTYRRVEDIAGSMGSSHNTISYCRDLVYILNARQVTTL